ncbi:MAG: hypothetical protein AB7U41_04790 [Dongiaceae bacterium]
MRLILFPRFLLMAALFLTTACASAPMERKVDLSFNHLEPVRLAVKEIRIVDAFIPSNQAPYLEQRLSPSPSEVIQRWAEKRFAAAGGYYYATLRIEQASVVEQQLPRQTGLPRLWQDQAIAKHLGKMRVRLDIEKANEDVVSFIKAEVARERPIAESLSPAAVNQIDFMLVENMIYDLDNEMMRQINRYLSDYLR